MRKVIAAVLALTLVGCADDRLRVINNNDRVTDLERRMTLNEQADLGRDALIGANSDAIALESQTRADADQALLDLINQESAARRAGDTQLANALAASIIVQSIVNSVVQGQISRINQRLSSVGSSLTSLQTQINNLSSDVNSLEVQLNQALINISGLETRISGAEGAIGALQDEAEALSDRLDAEGVKLLKCNSPSSTERIMKINGKFYAVMNRVTTENVSYTAASGNPVTIITPDLCRRGSSNNYYAADDDGDCKGNHTKVPGSVTTVQPGTTRQVTVVTSAQIALEILNDNSYRTTDGANCSFSISGGGTVSSNLVVAQ